MKLSRIAFLVATSALASLSISAHAQTITFDNLPTTGQFNGNGNAFTSYTENDFTASAPAGQFVQATNPFLNTPSTLPALLTGTFNGATNATLTVTGTGMFYLSSLDLFLSELGPQQPSSSYSITGYLGNVLQYFTPPTILSAGLNQYSTGGDKTPIDRLAISTSSLGQLYLDNINVTPVTAVAAVPEPATWGMMIAGFGAVGFAMRRRRTQATVRFA